MLIATLRFRRTFASVLLVVALTPHLAWSQATDDILPTEGSLAMEKEHRERSKGINMLLKGETPFDPKDAKQAEMLDYEARYMVYRLTWPEWQDNKDPQKNIDRLFHYCDLSWGQLSKDIAAGKVNKAVAANLTKAIITRAVEV